MYSIDTSQPPQGRPWFGMGCWVVGDGWWGIQNHHDHLSSLFEVIRGTTVSSVFVRLYIKGNSHQKTADKSYYWHDLSARGKNRLPKSSWAGNQTVVHKKKKGGLRFRRQIIIAKWSRILKSKINYWINNMLSWKKKNKTQVISTRFTSCFQQSYTSHVCKKVTFKYQFLLSHIIIIGLENSS